MQSRVVTNIDLKKVSQSAETLELELTDDFFAALEQDEIEGGCVKATIEVKESISELFLVNIHVEGEVRVKCDRCLEDLILEVDMDDEIKFYGGDADLASQDENVRVIEGNGYKCDLSWDLYEMIVVSLPLQRVHELGGCDDDMLGHLLKEDSYD